MLADDIGDGGYTSVDATWAYKAPSLIITMDYSATDEVHFKNHNCDKKHPCFKFVKATGEHAKSFNGESNFVNWDVKK